MTDITAYIGEPVAPDLQIQWCSEHDGTTEGPRECDARRAWLYDSPCSLRPVVVLAGMETVTLSEVWGKESSPGSIHKVEWIAEYIGDSRASHRRLAGPWEPVEE